MYKVVHIVLCTYCTMCIKDMRCCVHMALCTCWICNFVYIGFYVHVVYAVLCTYGVVHVVHLVLCTYGVVCMIVHVVLCTSGIVYTLYMWYDVHVALCTHCAGGVVYM